MTGRFATRLIALAALCSAPSLADNYSGPRPPKPDVPYLQHANNLLETEVTVASEQTGKNETTYVVEGPASPARTPLAEPLFLMQAEKISPEKLELYPLEAKRGNREITFSEKKRKNNPRPLRLSVTRLADGLYRIEANEPLENGEYSLTPAGSNQVFCFQVY